MDTIKKIKIFGSILVLLALVIVNSTSANVSSQSPAPTNLYQTYTFFATSTSQTAYATSTNATSTNINAWVDSNGRVDTGSAIIVGAKKVTVELGRNDLNGLGGGNTGSTRFKIQVSPNGSDWYYWNKWQENASSSFSGLSKSYTTSEFVLTGTSTILTSMDLGTDSFYSVRCVVTEVTDGAHTCKAYINY